MSGSPQPTVVSTKTLTEFAPILDVVWKLTIAASVVLYTLGLLISNYRLQQFGSSNLELAKAEYILVGFLWAVLALIGYTLWRAVRAIWEQKVTFVDDPKFKKPIWRGLGALIVAGVFGVFFGTVGMVLDVGAASSPGSWIVYAYTLALGWAIDNFLQSTVEILTSKRNPFAVLIDHGFFVHLTRTGLPLVAGFALYAITIYPMISSAVGGGRLPKANVVVKTEYLDSLRVSGVEVTDSASLGVWSIVSDSSSAVLVTNQYNQSILPKGKRVTLWIPKDAIRLIRFIQSDEDVPPPVPR